MNRFVAQALTTGPPLPGEDAAAFQSDAWDDVLSPSAVETLKGVGYLVVADAFPAALAARVASAPRGDVTGQGRAVRRDAVSWVDETSPDDAVARAASALKALPNALNDLCFREPVGDADATRGFLVPSPPGPGPPPVPVRPATPRRPLTVPRRLQLSSFDADADVGYAPHSDNGPAKNGGRKNHRHVTAILYCNRGWRPSHGGQLRLWPDSLDDDAVRRALVADSTPALQDALKSHRSVDVLPEAGTLLLFDSRLVHAVLPPTRRRRALTLWIGRPVDDDTRGEVYDA